MKKHYLVKCLTVCINKKKCGLGNRRVVYLGYLMALGSL